MSRPTPWLRHVIVTLVCLAGSAAASVVVSAQGVPSWAYPVNPPDFKPRVEDGTPRRRREDGRARADRRADHREAGEHGA
jgi:hypothetical protein